MQPGRRCPFAQASPSPRTKGVLSGHCHSPCDKPERTAQPRLLVREGAARAGRPGPGACPIQRALAGNLEKRTPGPPGLPVPWPSLGERQWPDSSVTAANWPPVPTSPGGRQPIPKDRAALAPDVGTQAGGAARPSSESGPVAVDAPLREMHADPRVHCALS